uniref:Uncharacterized protein n=1 Tax=Oryza brachyantha TaxID=4533 RepID=J3MXE0_ORYBR
SLDPIPFPLFLPSLISSSLSLSKLHTRQWRTRGCSLSSSSPPSSPSPSLKEQGGKSLF